MTDNSTANTLGDLGRLIQQLMNWGVYVLLAGMYQVFFNVASAQLFESETIKNFYGRVQLIIGVFMVFKLAVSILQGIMDPDKFMNPKEGFGNFITRVVVALALLTVIVPINIPDVENANSFEKYLNNNGLLFGTLYSLQDRILSNNTLGRLILGTTDNATNTESPDTTGMTEAEIQQQKLTRSSRIFTSTILKAFLKINLLPPEVRENDDETNKENWYCGSNLDDDGKNAIASYQELDVDPTTLLSMEVLTADCKVNDSIFDHLRNAVSWIPILGGFVENTRYVFAFNWLASAIVGIVFLIILIGFTIDIAVRSIKLAVLRLLAPIPIISYIEPKSSKDGGMFSSWVKALTSTYLDLFLRLAIVYFVIFLIQDMIANGIIINETGGLVGGFSIIFIMLGLFFFAKMAPKFIKDALGLKGSMSNIGLSGILAGAGAIRQGGTIFEAGEAMNDATRAQVQAYNHGKQAPELGESWNSGRDYAAKILTGDQNMSGRRMSRGAHHLKRMGITTPYAEGLKNQMYDAQDFAAQTKDQYDRYNEGKLTGNERAILQNELDGAITNYENQGYDRREAFRRALQDRMFTAQADAGKAKSKYEKVEGMQKQYGQARSYEAQFEGEDGRYMARNFTNRALGGLGRDSQTSRVQQWRTQKYPGAEATSSTNPTGAGVDMNPVGGMGEHTHDNE
ncbi:MAG TPA: hypothetical protein IAD45_02895 [Candidatus Faecimonas intestinavium]|nr:hypothetical protein [Bacilli bacterium]HIT23346.1 hypothetical protein [Candidatus Faecimonas intestinavium]